MSARRFSGEQIRAAIKETHGNVKAAAEGLGITRKNLYDRLAGLGVDPAAVRSGGRAVPLVRVRPDHTEALRQASFDLAAKRRTETTASDVLAELIEETLPGWLRSKVGPA